MADPGRGGTVPRTGSPLSPGLDPVLLFTSSLTREEAVVSWTPISWFYIAGVVMVGPIGVKKPGALPPDCKNFYRIQGGTGSSLCLLARMWKKSSPKKRLT